MNRFARICVGGSLVGSGVGILYPMVYDLLTTDQNLELWEFAVILLVPLPVSFILFRAIQLPLFMILTVGYLTLFIPVMSAHFGSSGTEPFWQFLVLGVIGGFVWSIPFVIKGLIKRG